MSLRKQPKANTARGHVRITEIPGVDTILLHGHSDLDHVLRDRYETNVPSNDRDTLPTTTQAPGSGQQFSRLSDWGFYTFPTQIESVSEPVLGISMISEQERCIILINMKKLHPIDLSYGCSDLCKKKNPRSHIESCITSFS